METVKTFPAANEAWEKSLYTEEEAFRDRIGTLTAEGKRRWIYAKKPAGLFTKYREGLAWLLLAFLFGAPFIRVNGHPLLLFNILERKFILFGQIFWPQDFHLFVLGALTTIVFIVVFTMVFGRLFCGWICPQTIFMEFVFRRIEYLLEGNYMAQKALDNGPTNFNKVWRKTVKHILFLGFSFLIGNTFLSYLIGTEKVWQLILDTPLKHPGGFGAMVAFTGAFYLVFSQFREQVCLVACPYGRLQGILLDRDSVVVAYDHVRGETRGKLRKGEDRAAQGLGDCISCNQCVMVCPTGIDIRNGTQLECIHCTACIDACDSVMDKINKPRGLVRYASESGIAENKPWRLKLRARVYVGVLVALFSGLVGLLMSRVEVETSMLRLAGTLYQKQGPDHLTNVYKLQVVNKTFEQKPIEFRLEQPANGSFELNNSQRKLLVKPESVYEGLVIVKLNRKDLTGSKTPIVLGVYSNGERIDEVKTNFMGPLGNLRKTGN